MPFFWFLMRPGIKFVDGEWVICYENGAAHFAMVRIPKSSSGDKVFDNSSYDFFVSFSFLLTKLDAHHLFRTKCTYVLFFHSTNNRKKWKTDTRCDIGSIWIIKDVSEYRFREKERRLQFRNSNIIIVNLHFEIGRPTFASICVEFSVF